MFHPASICFVMQNLYAVVRKGTVSELSLDLVCLSVSLDKSKMVS